MHTQSLWSHTPPMYCMWTRLLSSMPPIQLMWHFSIATTPRCRGRRYSFPWTAPIFPLVHTLYCWELSKDVSSTILKSLVWHDLGLDPGLLAHYPLYCIVNMQLAPLSLGQTLKWRQDSLVYFMYVFFNVIEIRITKKQSYCSSLYKDYFKTTFKVDFFIFFLWILEMLASWFVK